MKKLGALVAFCLSFPLLADTSPLAGVHAIYLGNIDVRQQREIIVALKHELPEVHAVAKAQDADVMLVFTGTPDVDEQLTTTVMVQMPGATSTPGADLVPVQVPTDTTLHNPGHVIASARTRDGRSVVLHQGLLTPATANQAAAALIKAWRAANP